MDLFDIVRAMLRQWKVVIGGLVALAGAAAVVVLVVPTNYQATGRLVLLLPPEAADPKRATNPYLNLSGSMSLMASLAASSLVTTEARERLSDQGYRSRYAVALPPEVGPVLDVSVRDTDPVAAVKTRDAVMARLTARIVQMQADVKAPKSQTVYTRKIATPSKADALPGAKIRALAVAGAAIILLTLIVGLTRDRRRLVRESAHSGVEGESPPTAEPKGDDDPAAGPDGEPSPRDEASYTKPGGVSGGVKPDRFAPARANRERRTRSKAKRQS